MSDRALLFSSRILAFYQEISILDIKKRSGELGHMEEN